MTTSRDFIKSARLEQLTRRLRAEQKRRTLEVNKHRAHLKKLREYYKQYSALLHGVGSAIDLGGVQDEFRVFAEAKWLDRSFQDDANALNKDALVAYTELRGRLDALRNDLSRLRDVSEQSKSGESH